MDNQKYDLEERTFQFALFVRKMAIKHNRHHQISSDIKQIVRSSGSVGANYIEANDAITDKDRLFRLRISKKEAKESRYWSRLLGEIIDDETILADIRHCYKESEELMKIFATIIRKLTP